MILEEQLIGKTYYKEKFMKDHENRDPVQILGELYFKEQQNELFDLSNIRFAQGEVYFHYKDFETAIFKWENIQNELQPWAKKNMADAYFELGLFSTAEEIYKSIQVESLVLNSEVALKLFQLYIEQGNLDLADKIIKNAVSLNPDYPNVTKIARVFFEQHQDWSSAVELSVNEATRTKLLYWFEILKSYVDRGLTKTAQPDYFSQVLSTLYSLDKIHFEQFVVSLWNKYKNEESFLLWIKEITNLILHIGVNRDDSLHELSALYERMYFKLIDGKYLLKELSDIIPHLLTAWLNITDSAKALLASSAVLAWNELFPASISQLVVEEANEMMGHCQNNTIGIEMNLHLFDSILKWAENNKLTGGYRYKWIVQQLLDLQVRHLLIAGAPKSGKSLLINCILEENIVEDTPTLAVTMFKNHDDIEIDEITDTNKVPISNEKGIAELRQSSDSYIDFKLPCKFLEENGLSIINLPDFTINNLEKDEMTTHLHLADGLLFVLNGNAPFPDYERDILLNIQKQAANLPIHFLVNIMDPIYSEHEVKTIVEETKVRINTYFPSAQVFAYSPRLKGKEHLSKFINAHFRHKNIKEERHKKLLYIIRKTITYLLKQRVKTENELIESIQWNKDILAKLNGSIHQLSDVEMEKIQTIKHSFRTIKEEMKVELTNTIPELLRGCSQLISEDSNFRKIHLTLNKEMNNRMKDYLHEHVLPKFHRSIQQWISESAKIFAESHAYLLEMADGFNAMFSNERIKFECDFKVLDDWRRDADRITSTVQIGEINILLRFTPSQILLKSAGNLLGILPQNKKLLYKKYKSFLESKDYHEEAVTIANKFFMQFELLENALERDISMFFRHPFYVLRETAEEIQVEIHSKQDTLSNMRSNPEVYHDPLKLFELRLRQNEWMMDHHIQVHHVF
ncbi:GTP-binding protein [Bacillus aquiflavi]|uniref:GTP-binding protein n=1 Tax=Bacillus aquiflavi TaxID=2672567 RepID=A0A6B3VXP3_9BACI|nr:GTP-binding protein [Bacillus aquiflavi]MBA4536699.1 GTP-binding protein [Bacillus aquiflavi]NEY81067.1 GTP-binding protein [Bacillus aquiflavi]UAC48735.1 GTP-binding protein [Bacillus aquiflavi]